MNLLRAAGRKLAECFTYVAVPFCLVLAVGCRSEHPAPAPQPPTAAKPVVSSVESRGPIPKIDVHMHIANESAAEALELMQGQGIRIGLNASGGFPDESLSDSIAIAKRSGGRLQPLCNIKLSYAAHPDFALYARQTAQQCKALGGKGIKIPKSLGLGVTDAQGHILAVDAPVFDPLFDEAGKQGLPVLIHSGDPKAFFRAPTPDNERYDELGAHPGWSFYGVAPNGEPWPSWEALLDQLDRRIARHPHTTFMGAHFGNAAEDPERVARMLAAHPNYVIDTAARVPEFGRHDAKAMRAFFIEHQDRILFGSDLGLSPGSVTLGSSGAEPDKLEQLPAFFRAHWLYFESNKRGLQHPTPIQGRWTVDAIALPRAVLEKLYWRNAARVFSLTLPAEPSQPTGH